MLYDVVYVLKNDVKPEEVRYSLRSIVKNFSFNKVWFYGGCPEGIKPDHYIKFIQEGSTKYAKAKSMYRTIFENEDITENFYLFNDDFFILKHYDQDIPMLNGTLYKQCERIAARYQRETRYTEHLRNTARGLRNRKLDRLSYECHVPMLVNRYLAQQTLQQLPIGFCFRSSYGNLFEIGGIIIEDPKIRELDELPKEDWAIVSTTDTSFREGAIGKYIRELFDKPCRYEL